MRTRIFASFALVVFMGAEALEIRSANGPEFMSAAKDMCPADGLA